MTLCTRDRSQPSRAHLVVPSHLGEAGDHKLPLLALLWAGDGQKELVARFEDIALLDGLHARPAPGSRVQLRGGNPCLPAPPPSAPLPAPAPPPATPLQLPSLVSAGAAASPCSPSAAASFQACRRLYSLSGLGSPDGSLNVALYLTEGKQKVSNDVGNDVGL